MGRILSFAYGVACYLVFLATFLYMIGFIGNLWVPRSMDSPPQIPLGPALAINLGLLALFALQHSGMARQGFKRWWTRYVPWHIERATYVLFTCVALGLLVWLWQPMGGVIWEVENPIGRALLYGTYFLGWAIVLVSSYLINHFDLFGLRQVWLHLRGKEYTHLPFATPWLYRYVRHPLYVGWFLVMWATPLMTVAHLVFALVTSGYILMAIRWEESDLVRFFGRKYEEYSRQVPMLIPRLKPGRGPGRTADPTA